MDMALNKIVVAIPSLIEVETSMSCQKVSRLTAVIFSTTTTKTSMSKEISSNNL